MDFTTAERALMAAHGLAVFEDRIILGARPPASAEAIAEVEARLTGPVPDDLRRLWATSFGGHLDYDLDAEFDGRTFGVSMHTIFAPDDGGYRDLTGWIEHEAELAEEAAADAGEIWSGRLEVLPFGGFEYLTRLYLRVAPSAPVGEVLVWSQGLPEAWGLRLHQDSVAVAAPSLTSLFAAMRLDQDPRASGDYRSGQEAVAAIGELRAVGEAQAALADRLEALLLSACVDWRGALESGAILNDPLKRRLALERAATAGDLEVLGRLRALGCDLDEGVRGGEPAICLAMAAGQFAVAENLLEYGADPASAAAHGAQSAPEALVDALLARGSTTSLEAALAAAVAGRRTLAVRLAHWLIARDSGARLTAARQASSRAESCETTARRMDAGETWSNIAADDWRAQAARLRKFAEDLTLAG